LICFGPKAKNILQPFIDGRRTDKPIFSPIEADAERLVRRHGGRPVAADHYRIDSYRKTIQRACDRAFPPPPELARRPGESTETWQSRLTDEQRVELRAWRRDHRWHPHQLRHNAATEIRRRFGLEAARVILGHSSAKITDAVYAERDAQMAIRVALDAG
jgi:integrase